MTSLKDIDYVKALQGSMRKSFGDASGLEIMKFLEELCGWYDFNATQTEQILNQNGKRQILATIKTLLELPAEQIVAIANLKEQ